MARILADIQLPPAQNGGTVRGNVKSTCHVS
jgi:hypothetical protein